MKHMILIVRRLALMLLIAGVAFQEQKRLER